MNKIKKFWKDHYVDILATTSLVTITAATVIVVAKCGPDPVVNVLNQKKAGEIVNQVVTYQSGKTATFVTEIID